MNSYLKKSLLLIAGNIVVIFGYQLVIRIDGGYMDAFIKGVAVTIIAILGIISAKKSKRPDSLSIQGSGKILIALHVMIAIIPVYWNYRIRILIGMDPFLI